MRTLFYFEFFCEMTTTDFDVGVNRERNISHNRIKHRESSVNIAILSVG